ncbi:MAG: ABC transporter ATP-binding protein/permease, partial [Saezia sp.]
EALRQIGVYAILIGITTLLYVSATYLRQLIQIRWRTTLTKATLNQWMHNKAYWKLNTSDTSNLDNPDQRIAEDCKVFVEKLTGNGDGVLDFFTGLVGLVTYVVVLWNLSDFALEFTLLGKTFIIEHYIVWAAPIYVLFSSIMTHWLGAPLMKLNVIQKQREADLRFALTHFRESKEAIALQEGEAVERGIIDHRYRRIIENWRKKINREFILGCFTRPYMYSVLRIPLFLSFPAYFIGYVTLGGLMQLSQSFLKVVTSLSWFIFSYKSLAELAASSNRLANLLNSANDAANETPAISRSLAEDGALHIKDLHIQDPLGNKLLYLLELHVNPGEAVWLEGPSGMGKSTLFKSIAGLWSHCSGHVFLPKGKILFLPQKPYLPLGDLSTSITYPNMERNPQEARDLLMQVGLSKESVLEQVESLQGMTTENTFSGGEQQRLIIARILSIKPDWVFLDEATSALDSDAEKKLYTLLRASLPNTGFIVIAHRKPNGLGELTHIRLQVGSGIPPEQPKELMPSF